MKEIIWNIPNEEAITRRIEELEEFIENFPESKLAPIHCEEIDRLRSLL